MIAVVDTGGGNLTSLVNALQRLGCDARRTADPAVLRGAAKVVLPGVGAADEAMARLGAAGLEDVVRGLTQPVLGICIGMQLLFEASDEGASPLLGVIPGRVARLAEKPGVRVPHMGWNVVRARDGWFLGDGATQPAAAALAAAADGQPFYFVHSFRAPDGPWVTARADHGGPVPAAVSWRNFHGVQFHPEKSQAAGARLLGSFVAS